MKWYKKQMDKLKSGKPAADEPVKKSGHSFGEPKMRGKKMHKPGEKRSRNKTDAIS